MAEKEAPLENPGLVEVTPGDAQRGETATLSIFYRDGRPVLIATAGTVLPTVIEVVDDQGQAIAAYATTTEQVGTQTRFGEFDWQGSMR
ncbi:hypothetical protein JK358_15775 [Nocardia sp. 2]|uniref:Uncharacterized protein n=1 Tax=Nocardia acididurans TaxID=2802282 RepID=A0ABS1M728_9NOCA|nr:hypothetical protein [Nocardia acididurans]MBL1075855.1 hypothetical protein [Nocardia acididurans]